MPVFAPGSTQTAAITLSNKKDVSFNCEGVLHMGAVPMSQVLFGLNAREEKQILMPVTMPSVPGVYPVQVSIYDSAIGLLSTHQDEDINIVPAQTYDEILRPNASGWYTELMRNGGIANYDRVNEVYADDDASYVYWEYDGTIPYRYDVYNISNHVAGSGQINSVTVRVRGRRTNAYMVSYMSALVWLNHLFASSDGVMPTSTWYYNYDVEWTINPVTGQPWTWADIDNLQIGCKIWNGTWGAGMIITQVYAVVNYTPQ